jgi:leucyl aminopeptidase
MITLKSTAQAKNHSCLIWYTNIDLDSAAAGLSVPEAQFVQQQLDRKKTLIEINRLGSWLLLVKPTVKGDATADREAVRKAGHAVYQFLRKYEIREAALIAQSGSTGVGDLAEGIALSSYQFLRYKTGEDDKKYQFDQLQIDAESMSVDAIHRLQQLVNAVFHARNLVNEPVSFLTAEQFSREIQQLGSEAGFKVEVLNKAKIEALKMGGLLAVNRGSQRPPTFNILEYKGTNAKNSKPIVLVGKGIVYDTGGLSLKPTPGSMDSMKCDMAGGAAVVGALYAAAKNKLPLHIIGLVPATDNRPGEDAYTPGDVITMMSGKQVEVLNTDAEGRLILADALHYAKKYEPELVIDLATLTGAAVMAIGSHGAVVMGSGSEEPMAQLKAAGNAVYERLAEMPFWDEYGDMIKSAVADIKNIGGREGGAITAGKFLAHFIDYPWIHIDIAGPAFLDSESSYRGKHGTGTGVRLLYQFLEGKAHG